MNQIIYNSFPRSGNVYSGYVGSQILYGDYATLHIPEIFSVKELDTVTIFRKPSDAISSLINKQQEFDEIVNINIIDKLLDNHIDLYKKYMHYAKENRDSIYIGKFEDLTKDTVNHFLKIAKRFNRSIHKNYLSNFNNMSFSGPIWEDKYDGHIPREKEDHRLSIENAVSSSLLIKQLNKDYNDFINDNATQIDI